MPKNTKTTAKKATTKASQIKGVTTLDAGNGLIVEVIETTKPTAKKTPPTPKKKAAPEAPATEPTKLRQPQVRILAYLAKQKRASTRRQIADGSPVDSAWCTEHLGSDNDAVRLKNDALKFPSLVSLGYIVATPGDTDEQPVTTYTITNAGREALKAAK